MLKLPISRSSYVQIQVSKRKRVDSHGFERVSSPMFTGDAFVSERLSFVSFLRSIFFLY